MKNQTPSITNLIRRIPKEDIFPLLMYLLFFPIIWLMSTIVTLIMLARDYTIVSKWRYREHYHMSLWNGAEYNNIEMIETRKNRLWFYFYHENGKKELKSVLITKFSAGWSMKKYGDHSTMKKKFTPKERLIDLIPT